MSRHDDTYERDELMLVAETDKAILVREADVDEDDAEDGENQWWIPRSVIENTDLTRVGEEGYVEVQTWWAEKNGLA